MSIGNKIKSLRKQKKWTQSKLASEAHISRISIGNYERDDRQPDTKTLEKIAKALGASPNDLLSYGEQAYYQNLKDINELMKKVENDSECKDTILNILNHVCGIILGEIYIPPNLDKNKNAVLTYKYNLDLYRELTWELYSFSNNSFIASNNLLKNKDVYRFYVRRDKKVKRINDILEKIFRNYLIRYGLVDDQPKENNVPAEDKINRALKADE